jgi:hypothetical protein
MRRSLWMPKCNLRCFKSSAASSLADIAACRSKSLFTDARLRGCRHLGAGQIDDFLPRPGSFFFSISLPSVLSL